MKGVCEKLSVLFLCCPYAVFLGLGDVPTIPTFDDEVACKCWDKLACMSGCTYAFDDDKWYEMIADVGKQKCGSTESIHFRVMKGMC